MPHLRWTSRDSATEIDEANHTQEMGRKSARGGLFSVASSFTRAFIQLFLTAILSRLLGVDDYGLMAMSATVIALFGMFSDLGMGGATVQRRQVEQTLLSALFWIGSAVGLSTMLLCWALSPLVATFYHDDRLVRVVCFSAIAILCGSLGSQHQAIMTRQARWIEINAITIVCQLIGGIIAVLAAWFFAAGYWALALQSVSAAALSALALWTVCRWRPSWPKQWREARRSIHFGGYLMLFNAVNYAHRQMDNLIVGRVLGAASLGLYSRGYNLFMLPLTMVTWPLASVVTSLMSRQQDDQRSFASTYYSALASVYVITAPLAGALFLFSRECVTILYGEKWLEVSDVLRILAIALLWQPAYTSGGWIDLSLGRSKRHFHASIVAAGIYLTAFIIGVRFGIVGMAKAYLFANMAIVLPWIWWTSRGTLITLGGAFLAARGAFVALTVAIGVSWLVMPAIHLPGGWLINFFARAGLYGGLYLVFILILWKLDRRWSALVIAAIAKLRSGLGARAS